MSVDTSSRSVGHVIVGFSASFTFTVNIHDIEPMLLVAVAVTVVVPTGKGVPGFFEYVIVGIGLPMALAAKVTTAEHKLGSFDWIIGSGHVIIGAEPVTMMVTVPVSVPPFPSFTLYVNVAVPENPVVGVYVTSNEYSSGVLGLEE